jgi:hypothetical protein
MPNLVQIWRSVDTPEPQFAIFLLYLISCATHPGLHIARVLPIVRAAQTGAQCRQTCRQRPESHDCTTISGLQASEDEQLAIGSEPTQYTPPLCNLHLPRQLLAFLWTTLATQRTGASSIFRFAIAQILVCFRKVHFRRRDRLQEARESVGCGAGILWAASDCLPAGLLSQGEQVFVANEARG